MTSDGSRGNVLPGPTTSGGPRVSYGRWPIDSPARLRAVRAARGAVVEGGPRLSRLTCLAARLLDADVAFVSVVGDVEELLVGAAGPHGGLLPTSLPVELTVCQYLVMSGEALLVPDLDEHPVLRELVAVRALGLRSYAGTPLTSVDGLVLGGLCVGSSTPRQWRPHEAALLADLASAVESELQLRVVVEELRLAEAGARHHGEQQAALHRVARVVAEGAEPAVVLQLVASELVALFGARSTMVLRFLPAGRVSVAARAGRLPGEDGAGPPLDEVARCANALAAARGTGLPALGRHGDAPCAVVPVTVGGACWGAVVVMGDAPLTHQLLGQLAAHVDAIGLVVEATAVREQLREQACTDELTGVANRRRFDERLRDELERSRRHDHPLGLLLLDLDHFKAVNDEHGHDVGDRVLREFACRVRDQLRDTDLLARLGGDEFAVLLPESDEGDCLVTAERVTRAVGDLPLAGRDLTVTVGAVVVREGAAGAGALYRAADDALYRAKSAGRDTTVLATLPHEG